MKTRILHSFAFILLSLFLIIPGIGQRIQVNLPANTEGQVLLEHDVFFSGVRMNSFSAKIKSGTCTLEPANDGLAMMSLIFPGGKRNILVSKGDEFTIDLTGTDPIFTGKNAGANSLLLELENTAKPFPDSAAFGDLLIDLWEMDLFNARETADAKIKKAKTVSEEELEFLKGWVRYRYLSGILAWPVIRYAKGLDKAIRRLPSVMEAEMPSSPYENESLLKNPFFRSYINRYVTYYTAATNGFVAFPDADTEFYKRYEFARQNLKGKILWWYLEQMLVMNYTAMQPQTVKRLHTELLAEDRSFHYGGVVFEKCGDYMNQKPPKEEKQASGKNAGAETGLKLVGLDGKPLYLGSLKGKVVYVDLWASWCGPCRAQFPYAKALKEKLSPDQKKKITFLYISIDDNETAWKSAIEKLGIEGLHTISPGGWGSDAAQEFGVNSIPRYLLIDKTGKIVNPNAPRPGDPAIYQMLIDLL